MILALIVFLLCIVQQNAQLVTEVYETCTAEEGYLAKCGPGANCFIIDGYPTCHCVVDVATGMPLAGNPYKACTWDVSGTWQLYSFYTKKSGFYQEILSPISNEPFIIRLDRTDAILKTKYITGAIFIVTALTAFGLSVCSRAFLDVHDNTTIIFEQAEGFLSGNGRGAVLRTSRLNASLRKMFPLYRKAKDRWNMWGKWQKSDGAQVKVLKLKKPHNWPTFFHRKWKYWSAYWYNDDSFAAPLLRLSTALFLDKTLKSEQAQFMTDARFIQLGWYGAVEFGSQRINIYSPADGKELFTLRKIDTLPAFTSFSSAAANLAAPFARQEMTYTGVAAALQATDVVSDDGDNGDETTRNAPGVTVIERLADRPAARSIGGTESTARRAIDSIRPERSLSSDSDLPSGFLLDQSFIDECDSNTELTPDSSFMIEENEVLAEPSLLDVRSVRLGKAVSVEEFEGNGPQRRLGPFQGALQQMDTYVPTSQQLAGSTWYQEIEHRYQLAVAYAAEQLQSYQGVF